YSGSAPKSWRSLVYAYGFRNPFRFDLDPRSGIPHLGDVGWNTVEEIDTVRPGMNGGWPCYEGNAQTTFSTYAVCAALYAAGSAEPPITSYPHAGAGAAVVGGMHYTGGAYPEVYLNSYFYGDYTRHQLWTLATDAAGRLTRAPEAGGFGIEVGGPVAFHPGPNRDVTYADLVGGTVERLVYTAGNRPPVAQFTSATDAATRTVTFDAGSSYDLDGDSLTYSWDLGDGTSAPDATVTHTYSSSDPVTVTLTVHDQLGTLGTSTATVYPANATPQLSFAPPAPRTYAVGDRVDLDATAVDAEDGPLPVSWSTALRHCPFAGSCHLHPDATTTSATYSEPFTDHGSDTIMVITVHATDSHGATASATYEAKPTLHTLAVNSPVALAINGETTTSQQVVAGSAVQVDAPITSAYWTFHSWSDNDAAAHAFTMPDSDLTLTARYDTQIGLKYAALGGAGSLLGNPASAEYDVTGGRARNFSSGRIYWSATTGAHEVHGRILEKYRLGGAVAHAGFPTTDEVLVTGGRASYFSKGRIYWTATYGAHWLDGPILTKYLAAGGPSRYGLPTTDVRRTSGGYSELYTGGRSIFWSSSTGAHLVYGAILNKYRSMGYQVSCLGYPTTDEYAVTDGRRNRFVHGSVTYRYSTRRTTAAC
ncbi:MAG: hypothetical protein QOC66_4152, partial [Pseudonocardiales bacterium]|nr:hypothetical protein [Pseudonocardiales bacterium]